MVYLLASLRMFVYCTVYGDGIHFRRPPAHPPTTMVTSFPLCICYLPSVTVNFSSLALLTAPPLSLLPPPPSRFSSRVSSAVGFDKHVVFCNEGACGCDRRHSHKSSTNTTHTHTHSHIQAQTWHLFKHMDHMQLCECKKKKKIWELIGEKCMDWANFYIYVPVYISTTLWPWVVFSSAVLHYSPHKGKECSFIF